MVAGYRWLRGQWRRTDTAVVVMLLLAVGLVGLGAYGARLLAEHRMQQREAAAVKTLRTLAEALEAYQQKSGGYPDSLGRLRGREDGPANYLPPERARLLESPLARDRFERGGYAFIYTPTGRSQTWAATVPLVSGYVLEAHPAGQATSRMSFYYADQTGAVRAKRGAPAGPEDPPLPLTP